MSNDHTPDLPDDAQESQFDVVAIGASAGGVEALHAVLTAFPRRFPAAVLIVQHMDPRHKSMLAGLLSRHCRLPVRAAANEESIVGGTVYLAQPDMHLIVRNRRLVLTDTKDQLINKRIKLPVRLGCDAA